MRGTVGFSSFANLCVMRDLSCYELFRAVFELCWALFCYVRIIRFVIGLFIVCLGVCGNKKGNGILWRCKVLFMLMELRAFGHSRDI